MNLTDKHNKSLDVLKSNLDGKLLSYLNSCVRCGLCAESCHYYLTDNQSSYIPGKKAELLSGIYKKHFTMAGKLIPKLIGGKNYDDETVDELTDLAFGSCSMCGRCTMHCSVGVDIPLIVRTSRSMLRELDIVPKGLQSTANAALQSGNNMNIPQEDLIDTLKWLEEDLKMEVNDKDAAIPLDKKDARIVYTLNPREPKFFPLSIIAAAKIFYAAKEDWTISTKVYDVTNYPYFSGDNEGAKELTNRHVEEMERLRGKILAIAECGHGFRTIRWEGPNWIKKKYSFDAISIIELISSYIKECRIKTDATKNIKLTTLHDPCNLVRNGGIIEEQRHIFKKYSQ